MGILASVLVLLMALSPMVVSAGSNTRYAAPINGDSLSGRVVVSIAASGDSGSLKWSLEGLKPGRQLVIEVNGGTCKDPGALVVRHSRTPVGSTSADTVALPTGSAGFFTKALDKGGVVATVTSGKRSDCTAFHEMS
jgi:hypothetical protein